MWNALTLIIGFYTVTYNTSDGSAVATEGYDASIPKPTSPTRTGYTFAGWSATAGGSVITFPHTPASAGDITLHAKWTRIPVKAVATVKPTVSGTAKVSNTLTGNKGTWTGYQLQFLPTTSGMPAQSKLMQPHKPFPALVKR